jgi:hypothetical protein
LLGVPHPEFGDELVRHVELGHDARRVLDVIAVRHGP